jgi:hypothetical protein
MPYSGPKSNSPDRNWAKAAAGSVEIVMSTPSAGQARTK